MNRFSQRIKELTDPEVNDINKKEIEPASETQLQKIEKELGITLPEDYREFLRDYGGIWLASNRCWRAAVYHLHDYMWGRASVSSFYTADQLLSDALGEHKDSYIPNELVTIAEDGNVRLFLAVAGRWKGSVYQWYPSYFPGSLHYYPELELISRSFTGFMAMLRRRNENERTDIEQDKRETARIWARLNALEVPAKNLYSAQMKSFKACYVYSPIGGMAPTLTAAHFKVLEDEIGFSLPKDYREFLRNFSGYSFLSPTEEGGAESDFPHFSYGQPYAETPLRPAYFVRYFHGYMRDDLHSLLDHCQRLRDILPKGIIPIANGGGLCLGVTDEDKGAVYIAGNDVTERQDDPPHRISRNALTPVAASFDELMAQLELYEH